MSRFAIQAFNPDLRKQLHIDDIWAKVQRMNRSQPDKEVVTDRRKAIGGIEIWNITMEHKVGVENCEK